MSFCHCFLPKNYIIIFWFFWFFKPRFLLFFFPHSFLLTQLAISPSVLCFSSYTTIAVLAPISCDHVTLFNYDKKARDLTSWCHLSYIMSDSNFHESMRQGITRSTSFWLVAFSYFFVSCFFVFFFRVILLFFFQDESDKISFIVITSVDMGTS